MKKLPATPERASKESGIALVIVVWLIVVLAVQVGLLNNSLRDGARIVDNTTAIARGEALMHAGLEFAISRLTTGDIRSRWRADGSQRIIDVGRRTLKVTINDENGRININMADRELIGGLLRSLDLKPQEAAAIRDRILARRDPDRERQQNRAEGASFKRDGSDKDADDLPFIDASDLARVLGTSQAVAYRLTRRITIYTSEGGINPRLASREVLSALPGVAPQTVERTYRLFRMGNDEAASAMVMLGPAQQYLSQAIGPAYRIQFEIGDARRDALGSGEAIVVLGLDSALPYRTLSWRFSPSTAQASESVAK
jgi:general secretion pathway protein K